MRIAIVSDVHGNLSALEAVLSDLRDTSPDLVLHGGDLADGGARPAAVVDCVIDQGWDGGVGNTDEMLFDAGALTEFARAANEALLPMFQAIEQMAAFTRAALGETRIAWMRELPRGRTHELLALVHASPGDLWRAPGRDASDAELDRVYRPLGRKQVAYGHIHQPFVRKIAELTIANSGSVGLSHDGDARAAYLLLDEAGPQIRRVEYDLERELKALRESALPHADWVARTLKTARPQMP